MQGINLARRPFVNRRPVLRLAILLWIAGVGLAIHNVRQFTGHWTGTSVYRQRLTDVDRQIREEREKLTELDREMARISLKRENRHTSFLNQLIAYRTFPWSGLFDDLEEVVPFDVRLLSVKPNVRLKAEPKQAKRPRRGSRSRPASAQDLEETGSGESDDEQPLRRDEVRLQLNGVAKTEDAVVELIEVLYTSPSFRSPFLPGEIIQEGGTVKFTLSTIYLTNSPGADSEATSADAEAVAAKPPETEGSTASASAAAEAAEIEADALEDGTGQRLVGERRPDTGAGGAAAREAAAGSRATGSRATESSQTGSRRESTQPHRGQSAEPENRVRPRTLPGAGAALPGAGTSSTSAAPGAAGDSSPPAPGEPTFAQPAASATPELNRGALIAPRTARPAAVAPAFDLWEARA